LEARARCKISRDHATKVIEAEVDIYELAKLAQLWWHRSAKLIYWKVDMFQIGEIGDARRDLAGEAFFLQAQGCNLGNQSVAPPMVAQDTLPAAEVY
jgi:hypothetical protein